jgi:hypothetical protein
VLVTIEIVPGRRAKGDLLMAGLVEEVNRLWGSISNVKGTVVPGGQLEVDNLYVVLNWLRRALTTVRSLDLEVFEKSDSAAYVTARTTESQGLSVRGLTAPRNNAVHHPEFVDPQLVLAVGPLDGGMFLIYPRWRVRDVELHPMFTRTDGNPLRSYMDAYDRAVQGRPLLDPLLDTLAFFDRLARR